MQNPSRSGNRLRRINADLATIDGPFTAHLRGRHTSAFVIDLYTRFLRQVAGFLSKKGKSISRLRRQDVPAVIRGCLPGWQPQSSKPRKAGLHSWLKFIGRFHPPGRPARWQPWVDDYARFLESTRALAPITRSGYLLRARQYLAWQFRRGPIDWRSVRPQDIWRYAGRLQGRGHRVRTVIDELSALRQFLRFMHLRGDCLPVLAQAVPSVSERPRSLSRGTLTDEQRKQFLASFDRHSPEGRRDYMMALCMTDLGLRRIEVVRLRLSDVDLERKAMTVPPAKKSSGRKLPLPPHVAVALRGYLRARPATESDRLFVGHTTLVGRPLSGVAVSAAMERAYRRCGFPWCGTHRLRRCFATRLYARGANMKEIADLLGHRLVTTTERYAQVDVNGLAALVRPWPT